MVKNVAVGLGGKFIGKGGNSYKTSAFKYPKSVKIPGKMVDGYSSPVDIEMTSAEDTQTVVIKGQGAVRPDRKQSASWIGGTTYTPVKAVEGVDQKKK